MKSIRSSVNSSPAPKVQSATSNRLDMERLKELPSNVQEEIARQLRVAADTICPASTKNGSRKAIIAEPQENSAFLGLNAEAYIKDEMKRTRMGRDEVLADTVFKAACPDPVDVFTTAAKLATKHNGKVMVSLHVALEPGLLLDLAIRARAANQELNCYVSECLSDWARA